jgi:hypothetical protein
VKNVKISLTLNARFVTTKLNDLSFGARLTKTKASGMSIIRR